MAVADAAGRRVPVALVKRKWVFPEDHPWRQAARPAAQRKASREAAARPSMAWPSAAP